MKKESFLLAFIGIIMAYLGFLLILGGVFFSVINSILTIIGIPTSLLLVSSITGIIVGIALAAVGLKIFFENESGLAKLFLGFLGIILFIVGFMAVIGGSVTFGLSLFATLLLWSIAFTFLRYAFELDFLKPFDRLVKLLKVTLGVKG